MKQLTKRIQEIIKHAGGTWGISLEDLTTNEAWGLNTEESFYAASVIKVPIMIAVFDAHHQGALNLTDTVHLDRDALVGGSGVLQHLTIGTRFTIHDLLTLMIIQSDNTATNILIDLLGVEKIQQTMEKQGLVKSKFYHKMMTVPVDREGINEITAREMTVMLKKLVTGKIISAYACEQMITIMKKQQIRTTLPGKIPTNSSQLIGALPEWEIANKTGSVSGIRHDIGIFYVGKRTLVAAVLSKDVDDIRAVDALGEIGLEIWQHLQKN
ncbi:serine hydrolase [Ornithinibacillus contaminans]|uniref:serine hydrolase n=1 Tax=Ornithinibacillus contaminans TaxID=694055 RepID=UPI00064DF7F0|nr:serine hydrolase [Ornithinibacillus contaminans]